MQVRIPAGAQIEGGTPALSDSNADRHLTVVDMASGWEYDLWQVKMAPLPADGGDLLCSWGGRTRIDGAGLSDTTAPYGQRGDATAARFGSLAGRVRAEEMEAGKIRHALFITINCTTGAVYPADGLARACSKIGRPDADAPPLGARFQLNISETDINKLPFPEWKKVLLRAAAEYGIFVGDTGASGYFAIENEAGNQYASLGAEDKWLTFAKKNGFSFWAPTESYVGSLDGRLPDGTDIWSKLRIVVTPRPVAQTH